MTLQEKLNEIRRIERKYRFLGDRISEGNEITMEDCVDLVLESLQQSVIWKTEQPDDDGSR